MEDRRFTAQFLLAGSYGLTQILYQVAIAIERGFDSDTHDRSMYDLFNPEVGIHFGAKHLKSFYDGMAEQNWWWALYFYNGEGPEAEKYANRVYYKIYKQGNGDYAPIE